MTMRRTSPAKIFPKSLNEKDINLDISEINSRIPTKNKMGLLKLINFPAYLKIPRATIPKNCIPITAMSAKASVVLRSAFPDRRSGTKTSLP